MQKQVEGTAIEPRFIKDMKAFCRRIKAVTMNEFNLLHVVISSDNPYSILITAENDNGQKLVVGISKSNGAADCLSVKGVSSYKISEKNAQKLANFFVDMISREELVETYCKINRVNILVDNEAPIELMEDSVGSGVPGEVDISIFNLSI